MKKIMSIVLASVAAAAVAFTGCQNKSGSAGSSRASAAYPTKPVTCIICYGPGGGSDNLVRSIMKVIKLPGGYSFVAVNTEGAAGFTGAMRLYNSPADGYTIMAHNIMDLLSYYESGQDSIPIVKEATFIAWVVADYNIVCTNKTFATENNVRTIEDLVAYCKANPSTKLRWGVAGSTNVNMIDSQRVARELGIFDNVVFTPYDGGSNTRIAALGNEIQIETSTASEMPGVVASGDNIPLLVINGERIRSYPNVPCTVEVGINVTTPKPRGFYGPKNMNPEHVKILDEAFRAACESPEFQESVEKLGLDMAYVDSATAYARATNWIDELQPFFDEYKKQK